MHITTFLCENPQPSLSRRAFTLIELSIVLVIIGLIVGGVLVGQDLIRAAAVRAQVTQIEKLNTAVNTFKSKYGYLPGDIPPPDSTNFGFISRGGAGLGDGNGVIEGRGSLPAACGFCAGSGEATMFWVDLSTAHLIDGTFNTAIANGGALPAATGSTIDSWLPNAKIGNGNYIYVWSGGQNISFNGSMETGCDGVNYFGLSTVTKLNLWEVFSSVGLTVNQAYQIDTKMDDGLPQSGSLTALYLNYASSSYKPVWAAGSGAGASSSNAPTTTATAGSSTTCYDNGGNTGTPQQYSVEMNGGNNVNCALSFRFQ